jgi:hypothetical protein
MKPLVVVALVLAVSTSCGDDEPAVTSSPSVTASVSPSALPSASPTPTGSKECVDLAKAVVVAKLAGPMPTEEVAERVAESLDAKLSRLTPKVHDPAVDLHGHLHDLASALRRGRTERAQLMVDRARANARALASACHMPADAFLGTS